MTGNSPRIGIASVLACLTVLCWIPGAQAAERVSLRASFSPDRLAASTTIGFGFDIVNTSGGSPAPLSSLSMRLPPGMGFLTTTLGLATCTSEVLLAQGLAGCPPNSRLGSGSAFVEVPFGLSTGYEIPNIQAVMGPSRNGNIVVLFYADGKQPVYAQLVFEGELIAGSPKVGGLLRANVPLIPSVPDGPAVSIVNVHATIGPAHLTYYETVHGRQVSFHPKGVTVPSRCPRGGFPFSARFTFADGTSSLAHTTVPCPRRPRS